MMVIEALVCAAVSMTLCADPGTNTVVNELSFTDHEKDVLELIDNRLAAGESGAKLLTWTPFILTAVNATRPKGIRKILKKDQEELKGIFEAATGLKKIALLTSVKDCQLMVLHLQRKGRAQYKDHIVFWRSLEMTFQEVASSLP